LDCSRHDNRAATGVLHLIAGTLIRRSQVTGIAAAALALTTIAARTFAGWLCRFPWEAGGERMLRLL
jgi:hypothetical protein